MTKVSVLGQEPKKELEKIEFVKWLDCYGSINSSTGEMKPSDWKEIILIDKDYRGSGFDLIFCKGSESNSENSCLHVGHWNDGVV